MEARGRTVETARQACAPGPSRPLVKRFAPGDAEAEAEFGLDTPYGLAATHQAPDGGHQLGCLLAALAGRFGADHAMVGVVVE